MEIHAFKSALVVVALLASGSVVAALPCTPAAPDDPQPWVHEAAVLASFPQEDPAPQWVGSFLDRGSYYWLTLWRDERGHFGSLASPVVDQDSPSAPIEGVEWDAPTRTLRFTSKPSINIEMTGVLTGARFRVTAVNPKWSPDQKLPILLFNNVKLRSDWRSRSQFECAMTMWRRR
jgi:hypothetical protein